MPDHTTSPSSPRLQRFSAPFDWVRIDSTVLVDGGAVLEGLIELSLVERLNTDIDIWLQHHPAAGLPDSGSQLFDDFLGHRTIRLQGLCAKFTLGPDIVGHPAIVAWAERLLAATAASVLLNAGELIQIGPGEPAQFPHRDSDTWPLPVGEHPLIVNAIVALTAFTTDNGASAVAAGSHRWEPGRYPTPDETTKAIMRPGDAFLFRGDVVHHGGANTTSQARRGLSVSYCAGWLRPVENSMLNVPPEPARALPRKMQDLLGYATHDATPTAGGILGLYENGDPHRVLTTLSQR